MFGEPWGYGDYGLTWSSRSFSPLRQRPGSSGAYDRVELVFVVPAN